MGGGSINSSPAGFWSAKNPFVFQQRIGRKFPAQKRTSPAGFFCREIAPKRRGGRERYMGGDTPPPLPPPPISQEQANRPWPSAGSGPGVPPPSPGGAGGSRARWALRPRGRSQPPLGCRGPGVPTAEGGGGGKKRTPQFQRRKRLLLLTHPASKKGKRLKPNRGRDLGFFLPPPCLSLTWGRSPPSPPGCSLTPPPKTPSPPEPPPRPAAGPDPSLLTICFSLGKVSGAILWPTHRGYICSKCWVASAGEALIPHHVQFPI